MSEYKSSLRKFKDYKKYRDIVDIKSYEVIISIIATIIISTLIIIVVQQASLSDINDILRGMTKDIGIALIGFLAVVISGLAILISSLNSRFINVIIKKDMKSQMEKILLSFFLLGLLVGFIIFLSFVFYICTYFNYNYNIVLIGLCTVVLSYLIFFVIFYSTSLIGNCIEVFCISNTAEIKELEDREEHLGKSNESYTNDNDLYTLIRITALERVALSDINTKKEKLNLYIATMFKAIDENCTDELQRVRLRHMVENMLERAIRKK